MALKMKPEDFAQLEQAVQSALAAQPSVTLISYLEQGMTAMRFRWDALRASGFDVCPFYAYLNDNHIDSALRRITRTN